MSIDNLEKLNYSLPLVSSDVVGVPTNGDNVNTTYHTQSSLKRPRTEDYPDIGIYSSNKLSNYICSESRSYSRAKTFLTVRHNSYVYHTEEWKPKGCTMYLPLCEDIMINTQNIEQISFESDQFFLADEKGNYVGAKPGNAVHLWRFDPTSRKLYISRSILFLKDQNSVSLGPYKFLASLQGRPTDPS
ncbi:uncharacterized protein TNIN_154851 [Trichonephila inaurata madagascariensis]|uniref:Uncharacterized protein n=1 Tax=Trichonephila inaurata madagascariensis TaxID=2747483 RepID=A0A8X6YQH7_9ARAC|nr:uncharacterized protein TNIN_154851 [Trichonephila inaurata madagascariensis]